MGFWDNVRKARDQLLTSEDERARRGQSATTWESTLTDREKDTLRRIRKVDRIINEKIVPTLPGPK